MNRTMRFRGAGSRARGAALIEALVGILIFAVAILGLVGLQVSMTRAQGAAKVRADAAYLGADILGTMWSDVPNLGKYNVPGTCSGYARCNDWLKKTTAALPSSEVKLTSTAATGLVQLTITWTTSAEGTHTYVLATNIN